MKNYISLATDPCNTSVAHQGAVAHSLKSTALEIQIKDLNNVNICDQIYSSMTDIYVQCYYINQKQKKEIFLQ